MNSIDSLPPPIQAIIKERVPKIIKCHDELMAKQRSLQTLNNQLNGNQIPKSLQFKVQLVIPKLVLEREQSREIIAAAQAAFKESLSDFQKTASIQMQIVAEHAVNAAEDHLKFVSLQAALDIIDFACRYLAKIDAAKGAALKRLYSGYPNNITEEDLAVSGVIPAATELRKCLDGFKSFYEFQLEKKFMKEVEKEILKEKKTKSHDEAEVAIMENANNDLVKDLIKRELKPIRDSLTRLNRVTGETAVNSPRQNNNGANQQRGRSRSQSRGRSRSRSQSRLQSHSRPRNSSRPRNNSRLHSSRGRSQNTSRGSSRNPSNRSNSLSRVTWRDQRGRVGGRGGRRNSRQNGRGRGGGRGTGRNANGNQREQSRSPYPQRISRGRTASHTPRPILRNSFNRSSARGRMRSRSSHGRQSSN
jgi:hypothetical protein